MVAKRLHGLAMTNLIYLVLFYVLYFLLVPAALYMKDTLLTIDIFVPYAALIPASTDAFMNFLLFVVVPIAALLWTLMSDQQPQYVYRG